MKNDAYRVKLLPNQGKFVKDHHRFCAYIGGIGSGKTYAGAVKTARRLEKPGYGMVAAPTYPMLRDSTRRSLTDLLDKIGLPYELRKGDNHITTATGHEIICRSLDNPETLRGPNLEWAWIDEAALVSDMAWRIVKGRIRAGDKPQAWLTTTPKGRNWIWQEWVSEPDQHHTLYRTRTQENRYLPDDFAEGLGYSGRFAEQELGGEFVAFEGLVYPMFDRGRRVRTVDTTDWQTVMGVDIGTRNPTAIITIRNSGDRVHIEREAYRRGMSSDEITDALTAEVERAEPETVYVDPSANDYILSWQRKGLPAQKANNDVQFGIGEVTAALEHGLTIDPSCHNVIAEFESYRYPDGGRVDTDKPVKDNDHAMDALRYAVASVSPVVEGPLML